MVNIFCDMSKMSSNFKRVIKSGIKSFWRSGLVSWASIFVMFVALFIIGALMLSSVFMGSLLTDIKSKVDINVYFHPEAKESEILELKGQLEVLPEVDYVEYVSRDQALKDFLERHKMRSDIVDAVAEVGENPLGAKFNIKAQEVSQYAGIAEYLSSRVGEPGATLEGGSIINEVNYHNNKVVIDRLSSIVNGAEKLGLVISIFSIVMSVLVTFSTIQLAIFNAREEISVMRLVGASNSYIRGPFIIEATLYGIISSVLVTFVLYPVTMWAARATEGFFGSLNIFEYYKQNAWEVFLVTFVSGILIGVISSAVATSRYLKK